MDVQEGSELCCTAAVVMCHTIQTCAALDVQEGTDNSSLMMYIAINTHQFCKLYKLAT